MQTYFDAILKKYPAQVPRYTSYPTAPHFYPMSVERHTGWISSIPNDTAISLYIHIPYCKKLCWFCGCNTRITQKYGPVETYLSLLLREIRMVADTIGRKQAVQHIHFGGGSPTILTSEDFAQLMNVLCKCFTILPDAEIAIEIDPRGISEAKVAAYSKYGVNRVSIGVQDFDASVQAAINRIQPFSTVYDTIRLCRAYGIEHISLDLIYGLPRQNLEGFKRTLDYALLFDPDRISLFGYAHVPWKKKNMRLINDEELPNDALRHTLFDTAVHAFSNAGYRLIGLDHFAKEDDAMCIAFDAHRLRRNFQGYTTDVSDVLIGLGASAISSFAEGYTQNAAGVDMYEKAILAGTLATSRGYQLTQEDRLRRTIIEELMCYFEVDLAHHGIDVNSQLFGCALPLLQKMQEDGLITIENNVLRVDVDCPQAVRLACAAFDAFFLPLGSQHAKVS